LASWEAASSLRISKISSTNNEISSSGYETATLRAIAEIKAFPNYSLSNSANTALVSTNLFVFFF